MSFNCKANENIAYIFVSKNSYYENFNGFKLSFPT